MDSKFNINFILNEMVENKRITLFKKYNTYFFLVQNPEKLRSLIGGCRCSFSRYGPLMSAFQF